MGIRRKQVTEGCDSEQIWGQMEVAEAQLGKLGIAKCVKSLSGERTAPYLAGSAWRCVPHLVCEGGNRDRSAILWGIPPSCDVDEVLI
jgi:hypothetical protein